MSEELDRAIHLLSLPRLHLGLLPLDGLRRMTGDLWLTEDKSVFFDDDKHVFFRYSSPHAAILMATEVGGIGYFCAPTGLCFYANSGWDASGNWEPSFEITSFGSAQLVNTTQGLASNRFFQVSMTAGMKLGKTTAGNQFALLKTDNIVGGSKEFQFPNGAGNIFVTPAVEDLDLGARLMNAINGVLRLPDSRPVFSQAGDCRYDPVTDTFEIYDGAVWNPH